MNQNQWIHSRSVHLCARTPELSRQQAGSCWCGLPLPWRPMQACSWQMTPAASALAVACCCLLMLMADATRYCPRQKLVIVRPDELGVTHITLYGQMLNNVTNTPEFVNFHAYVRMIRTANSNKTRLYGIGWVEGPSTVPSYAPNHVPYLSNLPTMRLQPLSSRLREIDHRVPVTVTIGSNIRSESWGFRLDATFDNTNSFYEWRLDGWERSYPLHAATRAAPGVICPWHSFDHPHSVCSPHHGGKRPTNHNRQRMKSDVGNEHDALLTPDVTPDGVTPTDTVPLVAVVCFGRRPHDHERGNVYAAQQLIRHVEYHLGQLGMQRMLVYCSMGLVYDPIFRQYLERYLPAALLPHVTLVAWNGVSKTVDYYYDQHLKYYHAVVSLWDYGRVLAALIDPDEYIAFPAPHVSLQQALARCNASTLDNVQLASVQYTCATCMDQYAALPANEGGSVDMDMWAALAHRDAQFNGVAGGGEGGAAAAGDAGGAAGGGVSWVRQCRWWQSDPLARYTAVWNDKWQLEQREFTPSDLGTPKAWRLYLGKHMLRPEAQRAFMHHHAEVMPGATQELLDPTRCPHVAHLLHVNEYRPWGIAGDVKYFRDPERRAQHWWLVLPGV